MPNKLYHWPDPHLLYPDQGHKSYRLKRLRFHLRSLRHRHHIKRFEQFINQQEHLASLLNCRPSFSYPLAHRFLDKRFSAQQRFAIICDNLSFLPEKLHAQHLPQLWEREICFGEVIDDFALYLCLNYHQAMEGFWALELRYKPTDQLIYLLTFGKVQDALLIGVIQGPHFDGAKELVKLLTKKCHGLRPAYLMVEAMKALTHALRYPRLLGIPHKYQNKSRWVQSKRYVVDYDAIFAESSGELKGYWELPVQVAMKEIDRIPSNKRSMYRKRYAMLEQLQNHMSQLFSH